MIVKVLIVISHLYLTYYYTVLSLLHHYLLAYSVEHFLYVFLNSMHKKTRLEMQKALEQDSTVYDYDGVYEDIQNQRLESSKKILGGTDRKVASRNPSHLYPTHPLHPARAYTMKYCLSNNAPTIRLVVHLAQVHQPADEGGGGAEEGAGSAGREEDPEGEGGRGRGVCRQGGVRHCGLQAEAQGEAGGAGEGEEGRCHGRYDWLNNLFFYLFFLCVFCFKTKDRIEC